MTLQSEAIQPSPLAGSLSGEIQGMNLDPPACMLGANRSAKAASVGVISRAGNRGVQASEPPDQKRGKDPWESQERSAHLFSVHVFCTWLSSSAATPHHLTPEASGGPDSSHALVDTFRIQSPKQTSTPRSKRLRSRHKILRHYKTQWSESNQHWTCLTASQGCDRLALR